MMSELNTTSPFESLREDMRRVRHFRHLEDGDLDRILSVGQVRHFAPEEAIFYEGEKSAGLFVLLGGRVHLYKLGQEGQESILSVIEPVIMFNEVPAIDERHNAVTAVAAESTIVWWTDSTQFRQILLDFPMLAFGLLQVLATRNRLLVGQFEDLSFRSVLGRTAKLLLDLSEHGEKPIDRYRHPNRELAARISTVPEAFSRSLSLFHKKGYIVATRGQLLISEPEKLARCAQIGPGLTGLPR